MRFYLIRLVRVSTLQSISIAILLSFSASCGRKDAPASPPPSISPSTPQGSWQTSKASKSVPKIVAFGDSLTAGLGLRESESYPALLQKKLDADGYQYEVVNAGVSGETSAGGLRRIAWALEGDVKIVIVELGANDILRGQPVSSMKDNLAEIIERAKSKKASVLLAGMEAPTNSGSDYRKDVHSAFEDLAKGHQVAFIPFLLDRVAGVESLNQSDGIHPNAEGEKIITDTVYRFLRPLIKPGG